MNDERCDRDRVTAIETAIAKQLERDYYPVAPAIAKSVMRTPALLEALDTIDKAREKHFDNGDGDCVECGWAFPCGTVQELVINGGNE